MIKNTSILLITLYLLSCTLVYAGNTVATPLSAKAKFEFFIELCSDTITGIQKIDEDKFTAIKNMIRNNIEASLDRVWNNRFNPNVPKCIQELLDSLKKVGSISIFILPAKKYMGEDPRNPDGDDCDCKKVCIPCKDYCPPSYCGCTNPPKQESTRYTGSADGSGQNCDPPDPYGPGNDHGDDWLSFSDGIVQEYNIAPGSVIYQGGYYKEAVKLLGGLKFDGDNTAQEILDATPVLFFPSGSLFGKENDSTLAILAEYVRLGGNIIVLAHPPDIYRGVQKEFLVKSTQTRSTLSYNSARQLAPGSALDYSIQSKYVSAPLPGNATVRLALEKFNRQSSRYDEIKTLLETSHDFKINGEFRNNGTYTPGTVHPGGRGRDKGLTVWSKNITILIRLS